MTEMQMRVKLNGLQQSMQDMSQLRKQLTLCQSELERVKQDLKTISSMDVPLAYIQKCKYNMEIQSRYCILFENVIRHISRLYESNEYQLIDYSENVHRVANRDTFENRSLTEIAIVLHKALQNK